MNHRLYGTFNNTITELGYTGSQSINSEIDTEFVFTGQYFDQFALASALSPSGGNLLILGSGLGACLRPALAARDFSKITLVDASEKMLQKSENIYTRMFPEIQEIDFRKSTAEKYLESNPQIDGTLLIDIFDEIGHAPELSKAKFFDNLYSQMSTDAVGMINAYTSPTFLDPVKPLCCLDRILREKFEFVKYVPHRRNVGIMFSKNNWNFPKTLEFQSNQLRKSDALFLKSTLIANKRLVRESNDKIERCKFSEDHLTFKSISKEFKEKLSILNRRNIKIDYLHSDIDHSQNIIDIGIEKKDESLICLPVIMAAAFSQSVKKESQTKFIESVLEQSSRICSLLTSKWRSVFVTQTASLIVGNTKSCEKRSNFLNKLNRVEA